MRKFPRSAPLILPILILLRLATFGCGQADPLFAFFELREPADQNQEATFDQAKPLLTITKMGRIAIDRQHATVRLTEDDTKAFAELTRRFTGHLLLLRAAEDVMEVMYITAPIEDGLLDFRVPRSAAMIDYLRAKGAGLPPK